MFQAENHPDEPFRTRLVFAIVAGAVRPVMNLIMNRTWRGVDRIPKGAIVVSNHVTELDPLVIGHAIYSHRIYPRFLAKESLFDLPVAGKLLGLSGQIPVDRGGAGAGTSLKTAQSVLSKGGCVVVFPDGTLTRDPDMWPMKGHTGAARLALKTGAPVVPMVHWGDQEVLAPYGKKLHLFPRKRTTVRVGDTVDLDDLRGGPTTRSVLLEATDRIVASMTQELSRLRPKDTPPAKPWNPVEHGQTLTGSPKQAKGASK